MPYSTGQTTKNSFLYGPEVHKLHLEFEITTDEVIAVGTPVKLAADGKVSALVAGDNKDLCIGVSIHDGYSAYGDLIVIAMRGYAVIEAAVGDVADTGATDFPAMVPGPVAFLGLAPNPVNPKSGQPAWGKGTTETGTTDVVPTNTFVNASFATVATDIYEDVIGWSLTAVAADVGNDTGLVPADGLYAGGAILVVIKD